MTTRLKHTKIDEMTDRALELESHDQRFSVGVAAGETISLLRGTSARRIPGCLEAIQTEISGYPKGGNAFDRIPQGLVRDPSFLAGALFGAMGGSFLDEVVENV